MRKFYFNLYWLVIVLCFISRSGQAQTLIEEETFETDNEGTTYNSSSFYFFPDEYFTRTDGSGISTFNAYANFEGNWYWAAESPDFFAPTENYVESAFSVDISSYDGAIVQALFAAGNSFSFESSDSAVFYYSTDNGVTYTRALKFSHVSGTNALAQDTDFDGEGDGTVLTNTFSDFSFSVPKAGSLKLKIVTTLNDMDEEFAFDNIRILGIDNTSPSLTISSTASDPTNISPVPVTFTFSEAVTGFAAGDILVGNGSIGNFIAQSSLIYTADITPSNEGVVSIDVSSNVATDLSGNQNTAASNFSLSFDSTSPTVDIQNEPAIVNSTASFNITIAFSEVVSGFTVGDIVTVNASASNLTTSDNKTFTVDITPDGSGDITIDVPANKAQDVAGNNNSAVTQAAVTFDNISPTADIQNEPAIVNSTASFNITIAFSEVVSGFTVGDIVTANASASNLTTSDNKTFTVDITPDGSGDITIDVPANKAQDVAGNNNSAASQVLVIYDAIAPGVIINSSMSDPTNSNPIPVTIIFSEPVIGFDISDISVTNGTLSGFDDSSAPVYTVNVTPSADNAVDINIAAGVAQDAAGNANTAGAYSISYDSTAPSVTITSNANDPTNSNPIPVTVTFSEPVTGFDVSDITVTNGTLSGFDGSSAPEYTVNITPILSNEIVDVSVVAGIAQDAAGNNNTASPILSRFFDGTQPTVNISSATSTISNPTNDNPFKLKFTFSEMVSGFSAADLIVINGTVKNFTNIDGTNYTADIEPSVTDDVVSVEIAANAAKDAAGNPNIASATFSRAYDEVLPMVTITTDVADPTNGSTALITFTFSEDVTDFQKADINSSNASLGDLTTISASEYTVEASLTEGNVSVVVGASAFMDFAGNANTEVASLSFIYDNTNPFLEISSSESNPTNFSNIPLTFSFTEEVTDFDETDIIVGNGTLQNFTVIDNSLFTAELLPSSDGLITVNADAGIATDMAGNPNEKADQFTILFDGTAPVVTIVKDISVIDPTNLQEVPVRFEISEFAEELLESDVIVSNGSLINFTKTTSNKYTAMVIPVSDGLVTVDIAANVISDNAGNLNDAASLSFTYDGTNPALSITSEEKDPTNNASDIPLTIIFSESVSDLSLSDIEVNNGILWNFVKINDTEYTVNVEPETDGEVTINLPASVVFDKAGNPNDASGTFTITFDSTPPALAITSEVNGPTNLSSFEVVFSLSEPVNDFEQNDIEISNGSISASGFRMVSDTEYAADILPENDGVVAIEVKAAVFFDIAGNANVEETQYQITYDSTSPSVVVSTTGPNPTDVSLILVEIVFSEDVEGFSIDDLIISNGNVMNFEIVGNSQFLAHIAPVDAGLVTITVAAGVAKDQAGNGNSSSEALEINFEINDPTMVFFKSLANETILESNGSVVLTVSIKNAHPLKATSVDLVLSQGDSTDINNYSTQTITFPKGTSEDQTITINITDDADEEDKEELFFTLQNATGGYEAKIDNGNTFELTILDDDKITGLEPEILSGVDIYPNPVAGQLKIDLDYNRISKDTKVVIYDLHGKKVISQPLSFRSNHVDVSGLRKGIYMLHFFDQGKVMIKKIQVDK